MANPERPLDLAAAAAYLLCPYCDGEAPLVTGQDIYPHRPDLYNKRFYRCSPCNAYVGCHSGTTKALGRLANAELRQAKIAAHAAFDPLWKNGRFQTRKQAYAWLSEKLKLARHDCHIGQFDVTRCNQVLKACQTHES